MTDSLACNIVLLPDVNLANHAIVTSLLIGHDNDVFFKLTDGKLYPHVSLYMCQLKEQNVNNVKQILKSLADKYEEFELEGSSFGNEEKFFDIEYEKTSGIVSLQNEVLDKVNPIRDGMREKDKARLITAEGLEKQNLESYGYRSVGELFRPHLTITRFKELETYKAPVEIGKPQEYSGTFNRIGLFMMGDNGTAVYELASFQLKPSNQS